MSQGTIEDRLARYGTVLEDSLSVSPDVPGFVPDGSRRLARLVKPTVRIAVAAAVVVAAVGVRSLTNDASNTSTGPVADGAAPAATAGTVPTPPSPADQCRQAFQPPDGVGVLGDQGLTITDLDRADAVSIASPVRPGISFVFIPTDSALVTCVVETGATTARSMFIQPLGEIPDSESIAVWGAGDQVPNESVAGIATINIFGRVGANITGVGVTIDTILTDGAVHDGWFLIEAIVPDASTPRDWRDVYVEWSTRSGETTGRTATDLRPELGLSDPPLRSGDSVINVSDPDIFNAIGTWINQLGLSETDPDIWRLRLQRACSSGVWNNDVGLALAAEFIAADLDKSVRPPEAGEPTAKEGANSLWIVAAQVCPGEFPPGALAAGPPSR